MAGSLQENPYRAHERLSDPVIPVSTPARRSKSGVVLGTVLGIGAGVAIIAFLRTSARGPEAVVLNETAPLPARAPAFVLNPGYERALAIPAGMEATSADEAQHASVSRTSDDAGDSPDATSDATSRTYDEREDVSGFESESQDSRPMDSLGRDTNLGVPDLDIGDLDVRGPGGSREDELEQRRDMTPTESLPGVGTKPTLPSTDNPY